MMRNRGCRSGINVAAGGLVGVLMLVLIVSLVKLAIVLLIALLILGAVSGLLGRTFHALGDACHRRHASKLNARQGHPNGFHMPQAHYSNRR
jgi:hypothetical protein